MNHKIISPIINGLLIMACFIGCAASAPTLTLIFTDTGDKCTYRGPKTISSETFMVNISPGESNLGSGYSIVMLQSGKTIDDLDAYPSIHPPEWVTVLVVNGLVIQDQSFTYDLTEIKNWIQGEPIYLVCFKGDGHGDVIKINSVGPINIKP
jgi:hypothetical protein